MATPFLACAAITAISAFVSFGFSLAALSNATGSLRSLALYTVARSLSFVVLSVAPFVSGSVQWLEAAALGMIIVQACDAVIGLTIHDRIKTVGPAATALANLVALGWLMSQ